jgi:hypothetical protein
MQQESTIVSVLIQGGSVGVALACLWLVYKMNQGQQDTTKTIAESNRSVIERNTDAWLKNTEALTKLSERIK